MLRLTCPFCGVRDEVEFRYRGDAFLARPDSHGGLDAFQGYVFERGNLPGWHVEWWQHVHGCRQILKVKRHTVTHDVAWVGLSGDTPPTHEGER